MNESYVPAPDEFVAVDIIAEMIHYAAPSYPRLAEQAGLEGLVWIKSLVGADGKVRDAFVYKSCGTPSLDKAALESAPKCKFKPGIKDGHPIAMWVTYKIDFILENR